MPLHDHFHGRIADRPWESFHSRWAVAISDDLNRRLPKHLVADAPMHLGSAVAADVVESERLEVNGAHSLNGEANGNGNGGVAVAAEVYAPPATALSMPVDFPTEIKVEVRDTTYNYRVIGVIELVSPANKKETSERNRFAGKCLSYLDKGMGLVVLDIVTERSWNLHNVMVQLAEYDDKFLMPDDPSIYVTSYRPVSRNQKNMIDLWMWHLAVGSSLPEVPFALKGYGCVRLDLEATYKEACERNRIVG